MLSSRLENKGNEIKPFEEKLRLIQQNVENLHYMDDDIPDYKFIAVRNSDDNFLPTEQISFDMEDVDSQNVFDKEEGTFSAPIDGVYEFQFNGYVGSADYAYLYVYVNGDSVRYYNDAGDHPRQVTIYFSMTLKQDDKLWLDNWQSSTFYASENHVMTFEGN